MKSLRHAQWSAGLYVLATASALASGNPLPATAPSTPAPATPAAPAAAAILANAIPTLTVTADGIDKNGTIGQEYAFCVPADMNHVREGTDKNIGLAWSAGPKGTKSYAIIAVDTDVPTVFTDANKEGKVLPQGMPRKNFYHWVLVDIPADTLQIPAGMDSQAIVQHGKEVLTTPYGVRGVNDFAGYFASDPNRRGVYAGYDGPCPPWNDDRVHHYHFKVYALDVATIGPKAPEAPQSPAGVPAAATPAAQGPALTGPEAEAAIAPHILAEGEVVGTYSLNPLYKTQPAQTAIPVKAVP